ncbi:DUF4178 domain-containing protein [Lujinxingia vulgaris]|uniref:DUF4178 domain-containing protein n=1 Tax=Lujinxingia vulgaris TaxID=2600176 RepID=A0A5C6X935_9DELT|nr:DUF4178 domain-containing protein [Lujinxingia vulgaris]TXD33772.1 DUF4178 domain-containing protein [Lujinxingia vulgaris]
MLAWFKRFFAALFGKRPEPRQLPPGRDVNLSSLRVGDVVVHLDQTYIVNQRIVNHANGFFWHDYKLYGGDDAHIWLSVEDDDELEVALYRPADLTLNEEPPEEIEYLGQLFRLTEKGTSDAKISRESGSETRTTAYSWDYEGEGGKRLSVQRWGESEYEVMVGEPVNAASLDLMAQPD